jgi:hypothetical protein
MYFLFARLTAGSTVFALQELTLQPAPLVATPRYMDAQAFVIIQGGFAPLHTALFFSL